MKTSLGRKLPAMELFFIFIFYFLFYFSFFILFLFFIFIFIFILFFWNCILLSCLFYSSAIVWDSIRGKVVTLHSRFPFSLGACDQSKPVNLTDMHKFTVLTFEYKITLYKLNIQPLWSYTDNNNIKLGSLRWKSQEALFTFDESKGFLYSIEFRVWRRTSAWCGQTGQFTLLSFSNWMRSRTLLHCITMGVVQRVKTDQSA